ncbi:hypothetical protein GCM10010300_39010 [Streptomyces olivaceoviridis]|uniref:hypothetical protein n=1 Tax=Streptomyces olivaceoviridis TaxID=1921 RepID=UPI001671BE33|nr:hypothetical protein [Streptomyces olivaceoviridis]GGY91048.1 hypothetical protein GCM10010300_39010 [Streptomyces olivaceoviridis]
MKLTKRFAAISTAAITVVLFSAGGAQAQGDGGLLSRLGVTSLLQAPYGGGQEGTDTQSTTNTTTRNNTNNNNNNNAGNGVNNNNNNNNNGDRNTTTNTNNNNILAGTQAQDGGGLLSLLGVPPLLQICYPTGQAAQGNSTFTGSQNINCKFS